MKFRGPTNISHILCDIEGTTTPIHFVHEVLFPYSAKHLKKFLDENNHNTDVAAQIDLVKQTALNEKYLSACTYDDAVNILQQWITEDRKHPALKKLQGMIWRDGFQKQIFVAPLYDDVFPAIKAWRDQGVWVGIYSSGSVEAQKLLFSHTNHGDLTPLICGYFDTSVGGKREKTSYENICRQLSVSSHRVLFLSDIEEELIAAREASLKVVQIVRDEKTKKSSQILGVENFEKISEVLLSSPKD